MNLIPRFSFGDSIQRRLLLSMIAVVVAGMLVTGAVVYRQAQDEVNAIFDLQLRQAAGAIPVRTYAQGRQADDDLEERARVVVRISDRFGQVVYDSHPEVALPRSAQLGLTTVAAAGVEWRVFAAVVDLNLLEVAQPMSVRRAFAAEVAFRTVLPLLILLPILGLLLWWLVGRGLAPLRRVAAEVAMRRPEALEHLSEDDLPKEVAPLVESLNRLLTDLAAARDAQRAFIADAAHELRTPLTALQLQLQVLERADDAEMRTSALHALREGLLRASRLVQQLLALARVEPDAHGGSTTVPMAGPTSAVDLDALAREAVALQAQLAHDRGVDLGVGSVAASSPTVIQADHDALFTLLGNLIDNALRYTPAGGRVDVVVEQTGRGAVLSVRDDGPGVSPAERERVFDRFHRGDAARAAGDTRGSGLGLAIVKRIADRHGAQVTLERGIDGRGLWVRVAFPASVS